MGAKDKTIAVDVVDPVKHDGVDLELGATVALPAAAAEALLASGAALPGGTLAERAKAEAARAEEAAKAAAEGTTAG